MLCTNALRGSLAIGAMGQVDLEDVARCDALRYLDLDNASLDLDVQQIAGAAALRALDRQRRLRFWLWLLLRPRPRLQI